MSNIEAMNTFREAAKKLKSVFDGGNYKDCLKPFKLFQISLITSLHKMNNIDDQKLAMECLEMGALIGLKIGDISLFEKSISQLKEFYISNEIKKCTKNREKLMGLYLMYLLTQNRLSDFHVELELLNYDDLKNKFIAFPMNIEQYLIQGRYNKIINAKNDIPNDQYKLFLDEMKTTVRNQISNSIQVCQDDIDLPSLLKMLGLGTKNDLQNYINQNKKNWKIVGDNVTFKPVEPQKQQINAMITSKDMLQFTSDIETIV